ncbi:MAG: hypothetical protein V1798_00685 [Pseudomonadota bacterium]
MSRGTLKVIGLVIGIPVLLIALLALTLWIQPKKDVSAKLIPPPAVLPGDNSLAKFMELTADLKTLDVDGRECMESPYPKSSVIRPECDRYLKSHAKILDQVAAWNSKHGNYAFARPQDLGDKMRQPLRTSDGSQDVLDYMRFIRFAKMLLYRASKSLQTGRIDNGLRDYRLALEAVHYLNQNPRVGGLMLNRAITGIVTGWLKNSVSSALADVGFEPALPTEKEVLDGLRFAWRVEEALEKNRALEIDARCGAFMVSQKEGNCLKWRAAKLLYGTSVEKQQKYLEELFDWLRKQMPNTKLGGSFLIKPAFSSDPFKMYEYFLPKTFPYSPLSDTFATFLSAGAQPIDHANAARIILAARRYFRRHKTWPGKEADVVPKYLPAWPKSRLNGEPISWKPDRSGVHVPGMDGVNNWKDMGSDYPFAPPKPL